MNQRWSKKENRDGAPRYKGRLERLKRRLNRLGVGELAQVEQFIERLETNPAHQNSEKENGHRLSHFKDWPHAPVHRLHGKGTYIVTAGTLHKRHCFRDRESLDFLEKELLSKARRFRWEIEAWAVFSNHYHFVGHALDDAATLKPFLSRLHADTARRANERDQTPGRQVWFNYWETALTYEKSYLARLNYVHHNAVRHGLVRVANQYRWCSAAWFERTATAAQVKTIYRFKTDRLKIVDDYDVLRVT